MATSTTETEVKETEKQTTGTTEQTEATAEATAEMPQDAKGVYSKFFSMENIDNNNNYLNLNGASINTIQLSEPIISVGNIIVPEESSTDTKLPL